MTKRIVYTVHYDTKTRLWTLRMRGDATSRWIFNTKLEAIEHGRYRCTLHQLSQLVIRGRNGRIQEERTYSHDPERYPG